MYIKDLEKQHMNAFKTLLITNNNKYDSIIVCNILFLNKFYPIWGPQKEVFKSVGQNTSCNRMGDPQCRHNSSLITKYLISDL